jgi:putative transcriptional regulator
VNPQATLLRILAAFAAAFAAILLAFAPGPARAEGSEGGSAGKALMLVAKPQLGAAYSQTVLLVVPLGAAEHVGFIINRPLDAQLSVIFPDHAPAKKVVDPIRFGGPMMADTVFALVHSAGGGPGGDTKRVFGDLFVASRATDIDRIIEQTPNDARYFVGFVGWRAGELDAEIAKGFWYVIDPQEDLLFRKDQRAIWRELVRRLGFEPNPHQSAL